LIERYGREVTPLKRTADRERLRLDQLKAEFGRIYAAALRSQDVAKYRDKRLAEGKAGATILKELNNLSHVIETARKEWGIYLPENPVKLVRRPSIAHGRDRRLVGDEKERLLVACRESKAHALLPLLQLASRLECAWVNYFPCNGTT
jgi:hypothetical protein